MPKTNLTAALLLALVAPCTVLAQDGGRDFRLGFRLGAFEMVNSPDSYDAVYGDPMPLLGVHLEGRVWRRLFLQASLDYGQVDGERVLPSDPPRGTGIDTTLTYIPLHTAASWRLTGPADAGRWEVRAGLGPSFLSWEDDGGVASADGTEVGGNVVLSVLRLGQRWHFGGEVRWSTFPDAVGGDGPTVTNFFDEDDLGGLSVSFLALRGF
jgi:hypothetical protein